MPKPVPLDGSQGYDNVAERFMSLRDGTGAAVVRQWSGLLPRGASILDIGCGHGVPISQALIRSGFSVSGVDASAKMIAAFRRRFPDSPAQCARAQHSDFFGRLFDGVVAWGLMFLLPPDVQASLMAKVARALRSGGRFLFTAPSEAVSWPDSLTGRESVSLGFEVYRQLLEAEGLALTGELVDEGENHYYLASRP